MLRAKLSVTAIAIISAFCYKPYFSTSFEFLNVDLWILVLIFSSCFFLFLCDSSPSVSSFLLSMWVHSWSRFQFTYCFTLKTSSSCGFLYSDFFSFPWCCLDWVRRGIIISSLRCVWFVFSLSLSGQSVSCCFTMFWISLSIFYFFKIIISCGTVPAHF